MKRSWSWKAYFLLAACNGGEVDGVTVLTAEIRTPESAGVYEGQSVSFGGFAASPDFPSTALRATWRLDDAIVCEGLTPSVDGVTRCTIAVQMGDQEVSLEVEDPDGAFAVARRNLEVLFNEPPTAVFVEPDSSLTYPQGYAIPVVLDVADEEDPVTALSVSWSVLDGLGVPDRTAADSLPTAPSSQGRVEGSTPLQQGSWRIRATVEDTMGKSSTAERTLTVGAPNQPPTCDFVKPTVGAVSLPGVAVAYETTMSDPDGAVTSLQALLLSDRDGPLAAGEPNGLGQWNGSISSLSTGIHELTLVVSDRWGGECKAQRSIEVRPAPVVSNVTISPENPNALQTLTCAASGVTFSGGTPQIQYRWNLGSADGTSLKIGAVQSVVSGSDFPTDTYTGHTFDQQIWCTAIASDGTFVTDHSASVTIGNAPPTITGVIFRTAWTDQAAVDIGVGTSIRIATFAGYSDPDGHGPGTHGVQWERWPSGGIAWEPIIGETGVLLDAQHYAAGDMLRVKVRPRDALGAEGAEMIPSTTLRVHGFSMMQGKGPDRRNLFAMLDDGTVWSWGHPTGLGRTASGTAYRRIPERVRGIDGVGLLANVEQISTADMFAVGLLADGRVIAWGANGRGQVGEPSLGKSNSTFPRRVRAPAGSDADFLDQHTTIVSVAAGVEMAFALDEDGRVWGWGGNDYGQIGNGEDNLTWNGSSWVVGATPLDVELPRLVLVDDDPLLDIIDIGAGSRVGYAVDGDGGVWSWGWNNAGRLGIASSQTATHHSSTALQVIAQGDDELSGALGVVGTATAFVWDDAGLAWSWGANTNSRLGVDTSIYGTGSLIRATPVWGGDPEPRLSGIVQIDAGTTHVLALDEDGHVWAWGVDTYGQLGQGNAERADSLRPLRVLGPDGESPLGGIISISAGNGISSALASDGTLWSWGDGFCGYLGHGVLPDGVTHECATVVGDVDHGWTTDNRRNPLPVPAQWSRSIRP